MLLHLKTEKQSSGMQQYFFSKLDLCFRTTYGKCTSHNTQVLHGRSYCIFEKRVIIPRSQTSLVSERFVGDCLKPGCCWYFLIFKFKSKSKQSWKVRHCRMNRERRTPPCCKLNHFFIKQWLHDSLACILVQTWFTPFLHFFAPFPILAKQWKQLHLWVQFE